MFALQLYSFTAWDASDTAKPMFHRTRWLTNVDKVDKQEDKVLSNTS